MMSNDDSNKKTIISIYELRKNRKITDYFGTKRVTNALQPSKPKEGEGKKEIQSKLKFFYMTALATIPSGRDLPL